MTKFSKLPSLCDRNKAKKAARNDLLTAACSVDARPNGRGWHVQKWGQHWNVWVKLPINPTSAAISQMSALFAGI